MTTTKRRLGENGYTFNETEYVAHLEDALMRACIRVADGNQYYEEAKTAEDWFDKFIFESTLHAKTGESPFFLEKNK